MAKKKKNLEQDIISYYMDYVLAHDKKPASVYHFAKTNNFDEAEFYSFYGSFEALEKNIFKVFFDNMYPNFCLQIIYFGLMIISNSLYL